MNQYGWEIVKSLSWMVATAITFFCAAKGYTTTPKLDMWLFGCVFVVNTLMLGVQIGVGK